MVDTATLDLANFLARNRQAGGLNTRLANALAANLAAPSQQMAPMGLGAPQTAPGIFGAARQPSSRPERPRVGGGSLGALAGILSGGATFPATALGSLVGSSALGLSPAISISDVIRAERESGRDDFRDIGRGRRGRERRGPRGERGRQVE